MTASAFNPSYIPTIGTFSSQQQYTNMYGGQLSVQKTINERTSLSASVYAQGVSYDSAPSVTQYGSGVPNQVAGSSGPNGMSYGSTVRGSFYVTPQVYVFAQPGVSFNRYDEYYENSNGWQANVGVGSNLIGLWQGEIWGGWQQQTSVYGYFKPQSAPAFGANIRYYPTPRLTFTLSFMQALGAGQPMGAGTVPTTPSAYAGVGFTQQAYLSADYGLNSYMNLSVRGGWGQTRDNGSSAYAAGLGFAGFGSAAFGSAGSGYSTQVLSAGVSLSYNFWRNTAINLGYNFINTTVSESTLSLSGSSLQPGYTQNVFSAGIRYSY